MFLISCSSKPAPAQGASGDAVAAAAPARADFPPPRQFGGFDARRAYGHMETIVGYGPRTVGSEGSRKSVEYLKAQLAAFGCQVEVDEFETSTPLGRKKMKNILGKVAGAQDHVILLLAHHDTKLMPDVPNFVGANDAAAAMGTALELARLICPRQNKLTYWFGFVDGEEAFGEWSDTNGTFGSRQMAARLAISGELKKVKAVVLLDLMGDTEPAFRREAHSTKWLKDILWSTARRLGYGAHFLSDETAIEDDHLPFLRRNVPAVDIIDLDYPHWHTAQDTPDKISPRSLAIVGHVLLESLPAIEKHP
jgi:hypothetical protein